MWDTCPMIVSIHVRMDRETRRQANVWAAKLGLSLSDFCAHAILAECISREVEELDAYLAKSRTKEKP